MIINTVMAVVNPDMPNTNISQPLFVHVPVATTESKGIASFNETDFIVANGQVKLNFDTNTANSSLSALQQAIAGLNTRVSVLEENIPLPTASDKGKILGVDETGKYTFVTLDDAEGVSV